MIRYARIDQDDIVLAVGGSEAEVDADRAGEYVIRVPDDRTLTVGETLPAPAPLDGQTVFPLNPD